MYTSRISHIIAMFVPVVSAPSLSLLSPSACSSHPHHLAQDVLHRGLPFFFPRLACRQALHMVARRVARLYLPHGESTTPGESSSADAKRALTPHGEWKQPSGKWLHGVISRNAEGDKPRSLKANTAVGIHERQISPRLSRTLAEACDTS